MAQVYPLVGDNLLVMSTEANNHPTLSLTYSTRVLQKGHLHQKIQNVESNLILAQKEHCHQDPLGHYFLLQPVQFAMEEMKLHVAHQEKLAVRNNLETLGFDAESIAGHLPLLGTED